MIWSPSQLKIIEFLKGKDWESLPQRVDRSFVDKIPKEARRYKCFDCNTINDHEDVKEEGVCPVCGEKHMVVMCPLDHCHCSHDIVLRVEFCPVCGDPICGECGTHSVEVISRITGYMSSYSGWNRSKQAEFRDRKRYSVA
jgi:DNA-directed RNA polymerase subunit RPC12/RpoP